MSSLFHISLLQFQVHYANAFTVALACTISNSIQKVYFILIFKKLSKLPFESLHLNLNLVLYSIKLMDKLEI